MATEPVLPRPVPLRKQHDLTNFDYGKIKGDAAPFEKELRPLCQIQAMVALSRVVRSQTGSKRRD